MPDLFEKLQDLQDRRSLPINKGGIGNYNLPQILPNTGYDPSAGESGVTDMPTRSRYDKGIMEGQNVDDYRSANQGGLALTGAFVGRVLGTGLAKVAEGFSVLGSAVGAGVAGVVDATGLDNAFGVEMDDRHHSIDRIINNPVNKIFFDLEDKIKEIMPVYHDSKWADKSVSQKFFGNFGEWMADQGADGIAFALSAIIPSAAVSKLGLGAAILGDASRGATAIGDMLAATGATEKGLQGAAKAIDFVSQYGVQTSSEALFEAKDTGEQMTNKYLAQLNASRPSYAQYKTINDLPDNLKQDAKDKIAGAMKNDYWWNMIALAPSNIFEMGLINKFVGKAESTAIKGIGAEINAGENIAADAAKATAESFQGIGTGKFKALSKSIYDAGQKIGATRVGSALKVIPEAIVSEGLYEENIQNQIQDMSMQYGLQGKSGYFLESGFGAAKQALEAITPGHYNDPKYKDTRESIFAGALIGALFGGFAGGTSEFNHERSEKQQREDAKDKAVNFLNSAKSDFLKQDLYETVNEKQQDGTTKKVIQYDEDGNPKVNKAAVTNFIGNQKRMADLVATEEYFTVTGQQEMAKIVRDERTTNWALSHLQSGQTDSMFAKLDNLSKAKDTDLQKLGFDPSFYGDNGRAVPVVERVEQIRAKAAQVKQHYQEALRSIPIEQTARIEELVRLKSRQDSMNDQVDSLKAQQDKAALEYRNDPDHVKQIDAETRRLQALEEHKNYLSDRSKSLQEQSSILEEQSKHVAAQDNAKALEAELKRIKDAHGVDRSRIEAAQQFHEQAISESKSKIDKLKSTFAEPLTQAGYDATVGNYKLLKNAGAIDNGKRYTGQSQDIKDIAKRTVQLQAAIKEHQDEYDTLKSPYNGSVHYQNRLRSTFSNQDIAAATEQHNVQQTELPQSEFEPTPQPPVVQGDQVVQTPSTQPEVVHTAPDVVLPNAALPESTANQVQTVRDAILTGGRLDATKLAKFAQDNMGKRIKVTYEGNDAGVFGSIGLDQQGNPAFLQDNGKVFNIERLAGQSIKSIVPITTTPVPLVRTQEAPTPKQSKIVDKEQAKEFDKTMYSSSKPYLAVGLNSTTGIDGSDNQQERWFRTTENLNLGEGKYQLMTVTTKNKEAAKKILGNDWTDRLLFDENTIKTVLLKDGKPVKADQFGTQKEDGELVFASLPLTPSKDRVGIIEYRNTPDLRKAGHTEYTHQNDSAARFIATEQEVKNGTVDRLLAAHAEWRAGVLADSNTKIIDITSKGSGIRVRGNLGSVQGRLTEGQTVDVKVATGEMMSDPSAKPIRVKPGLTYTEYKNMLVPLTGRNLTKSEQSTVKSVLGKWSQLASQVTRLGQQLQEESTKKPVSKPRENNNPKSLEELTKKDNTIKVEDKSNSYNGLAIVDEFTTNGDRFSLQYKNSNGDYKMMLGNTKDLLTLNNTTESTINNRSEDKSQQLSDQISTLSEERNKLKSYLEATVRFGDTDEHGIYIENGLIKFGGQEIAQEELWNNAETPNLDAFLADKYLQISAPALNNTTAKYIEQTTDGEREWKNYNEYLTSNEYPDGTTRAEADIPLRTSLAPIGEAQFRSVNLRYNGITDAIKPTRTDTIAATKPAPNTQQATVSNNRKELSLQAISNIASGMEEGKTYRVEFRHRIKTKPQEPFFVDYKVVDGKKEFVQQIKRNGEINNSKEPDFLKVYRDELNAPETITERPSDFPSEEIMDVTELKDTPAQPIGETVQPAQSVPLTEPSSLIDDVISNFTGDFTGDRDSLQEYIDAVKASYPEESAENIANSYQKEHSDSVGPKTAKPVSSRREGNFRGMTADSRSFKPVDINKEMAWFKERFPNVDIKRVNGLIQGKYWGLFDTAAGVLLSTDAVEGVSYHEAFHTASLLYNDEATRQGVYREYRERTGISGTDAEIEERLADEFRDFVLSDGNYTFPDKQQSFFQRLWSAIKNLFSSNNSERIEELFNKINNGGFANEAVSKELGLQTTAPMIADTAETFTRTHAIMEDMTVSFFDKFFADGNNINTLYKVYNAGNQSILIEDIYDKMYKEYSDEVKADREDGLEDTILATMVDDEGRWKELVKLHKQDLANLGLKVVDKSAVSDGRSADDNSPTDLELEGQKDNAQLESHIELSSKDGMPKIVKFFLSSLPELEYRRDSNKNLILKDGKPVLRFAKSAYGTYKVASPEKIMNILGNQLAGITDMQKMADKIKELANDYPTLNGIISRMQLGDELLSPTATIEEANFQTQFWQQFAKASHSYYLTYLRDDGVVSVLDSTSETQQSVTKAKWRTNLNAELKNKDGVLVKQDNRIVISKDKAVQLKAIEDPFKRASKLGIEFTFPEKIKADPVLFKQFRENLDAIINTITSTTQPVTDLYTRAGLNAQARINTLTNLEAVTNPDSIERQHIGLDNKTLYSLTLNNSLSLGIGELNNRSGAWFDAVEGSSYSANSIVLDRLQSDPTYKVNIAINEGVQRETADGAETSKLSPADSFANLINGIVNGYYSILRPGDKKLEYKLKFGEFIGSKGLITREGNYSAETNKIFRGYLEDEFAKVFALKEGYGSNIKNFNKHTLLPNGRLDLGIFNDILKDTNMPVLNRLEDALQWTDENKDVIDAATKKFLESTTNQYGSQARRLSVFKETLTKDKKKGYVGTGKFILNGIDDKVVNKVLNRDSASDRYNKQEIHQFFRYIAVNQLIGNIEQTKLTTGSLTFYKSNIDAVKRFSSLTGTKKTSRVDPAFENWMRANMEKIGYINGKKIKLTQDGNIRIVTVADLITTTPKEQIDNIREGLKVNGLTKSEIDNYVGKLQNINEADAQSWMHLPAYRELLLRAGDWTIAHQDAYIKAIKGQQLTANEIFLFPPLKPQGFGPQLAKGHFSPLFIKTSVSPLIPSVVKGTDLEVLMNKMYTDDVDMVSMESAIKVGAKIDVNTGSAIPLYDNVNGVGQITSRKFDDSIKSILPAQYMGIQLDVAPIRKNKTTRGTQHEKILMSNIANIPGGEAIVKEYRDTINRLVDLAKTDLQTRLGIQSKGDNYIIPDRTKLLSYLEEQSIRRGVPTNTLIGLQEALQHGSTLDAVVNKDRIDSILAAIITDGAIKGKRNGEQRVQVSISGYGNRVFEGDRLQTSDKLAPYVYDPTGTKPMEVMIALPKALVPYVEKVGGLEIFNKMVADGKIDERILKGVGFRIPTQQLSSMVYYKVKEFLPYESGPVVVLPSVITTIAGSDFDIDKLSMYDKNYNVNYGQIGAQLRPDLSRLLEDAGVLDQFRTLYGKLPEHMSNKEINELLSSDLQDDSITDDEHDKIDTAILIAQKRHTGEPSLVYTESDGNTKEALENKLIEINEQVLSHPHNFKNLIAPIGNEVLSGLAQEMVDLRANAKKGEFNEFEVNEVNPYASVELMNMNYLLEQGQRFQAGKDLLGIAAKQNTHHVLAQLSKLALKPDVKVWFSEAKDESLRLDHITDLSGNHQISDVISEFVNGFVDIVNDPFIFNLNANKDTINPFFYLTRVGVPIESVTSFLNQPVIRKYIDEKNRQNSLIAKGLPEAYRKSDYAIRAELREELVAIAKTEPSLFYKAKQFDTWYPHNFPSAAARDKVRSEYYNFTKDQLDRMITDPNTPANAYRQLQVMDMFLQYQEHGNQLTNLMMLNSQDTDGVKKSLARSYVEKAMYREFMNDKSTIFANPETVVNNSLIKPYFDVVMEGESYFSSLFDSKSDKSNELRGQFVHQIASLGVNDATDLLKRFENHTIAHLLQNITTENFPLSLSDEAIKATSTKRADGTFNVQSPLLIGVNSSVDTLTKLEKGLELPNDFVDSLYSIKNPSLEVGSGTDSIRMFTKRINKQQADLLAGAATDLLNSHPEEAKRLFKTTLVQSGLNNSYMAYHTLLPAKWFHNFVSNIMNVYRTEDINISNIIDDYYRNNWKNNTLVPSVQGKALRVEGDIAKMDINNTQYRGKLYLKQWKLPEGVTFEQYRAAKSDETIRDEDKPRWELHLYKYADNDGENIIYQRINPLGNGEKYQETSLSPKTMSVLTANNKTDNELPSSENYNIFTGYKAETDMDINDVPVSGDVMARFEKAAFENLVASGEDGVINQDHITQAVNTYKRGIVEGMTEEQAADRAEKEITCR